MKGFGGGGGETVLEDDGESFVVTGKQMVPSELPTSCKLESQQVRIPKAKVGQGGGGGGANASEGGDVVSTTACTESKCPTSNCVGDKLQDKNKNDLGSQEELVDVTEEFLEAVKSMNTLEIVL